MSWAKLLCDPREVQLLGTLNGGQSFRWTFNQEKDEWLGIFSKTLWMMRQKDGSIEYKVLGSILKTQNSTKSKINAKTAADDKSNINAKTPADNKSNINVKTPADNKSNIKVTTPADNKSNINAKTLADDNLFKDLLENYLRVDVKLQDYYKEWSAKDKFFKEAGQQFYGIRMLNQEPVENLFSFICSQNNHISRISTMVEKLCSQYGEEICQHDGVTYYAFPEVDKLAPLEVDKKLRELGFGYRAKFIQKSAEQILEWGGSEWFASLRDMKYKEAKQELMKLHGIGPKVADCICLMSLNHLEALPVDTHVYQIAAQNYLPHLRGKKNVTDKMYAEIGDCFRDLYGPLAGWAHTNYLPHLRGKKNVTDKMYAEIGDCFRDLYGPLAGWAHTVLFCSDLKKFQQNGTKTNGDVVPTKRKKCK